MAGNDRFELSTFSDDEWKIVDEVLFAPEKAEGTVDDRDASDGARWLLLYMQHNEESKVLSAVRIGLTGDVNSFGIDPQSREIHHVNSPNDGSWSDMVTSAELQVESGMTLPVGDELQLIKDFLGELRREHTDFLTWEKDL